MQPPIPKFTTLLARGARRKCPQCGQGDLFKHGLDFHDNCASCGLQFLPDQGDLWGPLVFLDRIIFVIPLIVLLYFKRWNPGWIFYTFAGALAVLVPIATAPHRMGMSLAMDYLVRRKAGDLSDDEPPPGG